MMLTNSEATKLFTPSEEEQVVRILKGECPHNQGWVHVGHGHNDDAYECRLCDETKWW
jgi:hypothetical protein